MVDCRDANIGFHCLAREASVILVTGATGNVGRAAVGWLVARDHGVRAAVDDTAADAWKGRAELVRFDWSDPSTWEPALDGVESFVLVRPPAMENVGALCDLSTMAVRRGCRRVVFLSVSGADPVRWLPHRKIEEHLRLIEASWTFLRAGSFMQNLVDRHLDDIREGCLRLPAGSAKVAWVDARDVGEVAARSLLDGIWEQRTPVLTGSQALDFQEVCQELSAVAGREVRYRSCSAVGYFLRLRLRAGLPIARCLVQTLRHRSLRSGEASEVRDDLRLLLGRSPRTMLDYLREQREIL